MPRKPIRERLRAKQDLPEYLYKYLTTGKKPDNSKMKKFKQAEGTWEIFNLDLDEAWHTHSKKIMAIWVTEKPGSRPWCWWEVTAPETRRQISGKEIKDEWPGDLCYDFGVPVYSASAALGESKNRIKASDFETELQYLKRLNFLTKDEKKLLKHKI